MWVKFSLQRIKKWCTQCWLLINALEESENENHYRKYQEEAKLSSNDDLHGLRLAM